MTNAMPMNQKHQQRQRQSKPPPPLLAPISSSLAITRSPFAWRNRRINFNKQQQVAIKRISSISSISDNHHGINYKVSNKQKDTRQSQSSTVVVPSSETPPEASFDNIVSREESSNLTTPTTAEVNMFTFDWPIQRQQQQHQQHQQHQHQHLHNFHQANQPHSSHHHHYHHYHHQQQHQHLSLSTPSLDSSSTMFDEREEAPILKSHYRRHSKPNVIYGCPTVPRQPLSYRLSPMYTFYGHHQGPPPGRLVYPLPYPYAIYNRFMANGYHPAGTKRPPPRALAHPSLYNSYYYASHPNINCINGGKNRKNSNDANYLLGEYRRSRLSSLPAVYLPNRQPPLPCYPHLYQRCHGDNVSALPAQASTKQFQRLITTNMMKSQPSSLPTSAAAAATAAYNSRHSKPSNDFDIIGNSSNVNNNNNSHIHILSHHKRPSYVSMLDAKEHLMAPSYGGDYKTSTMIDAKCQGKLFVLGIILTVITIGVIMGVILAVTID